MVNDTIGSPKQPPGDSKSDQTSSPLVGGPFTIAFKGHVTLTIPKKVTSRIASCQVFFFPLLKMYLL